MVWGIGTNRRCCINQSNAENFPYRRNSVPDKLSAPDAGESSPGLPGCVDIFYDPAECSGYSVLRNAITSPISPGGAFDNLESSSVSAGVNLAYWDHILSRDHKYQRPNDLFFQRTGKQFKEL